jgi:hypothetical protein
MVVGTGTAVIPALGFVPPLWLLIAGGVVGGLLVVSLVGGLLAWMVKMWQGVGKNAKEMKLRDAEVKKIEAKVKRADAKSLKTAAVVKKIEAETDRADAKAERTKAETEQIHADTEKSVFEFAKLKEAAAKKDGAGNASESESKSRVA